MKNWWCKNKRVADTDTIDTADTPSSEKENTKENTVVLMDLENLEKSREYDPAMERLGFFLKNLVFRQGKKILSLMVFTPTHLASEAMSVLYKLYDPELIYIPEIRLCPRNRLFKTRAAGGKNGSERYLKDVHTVDRKMVAKGKWLVDFVKDLAEIVVVTSDFDFSELKIYAELRGVRCTIFPTSEAFASKDYGKVMGGESAVGTAFSK